MTQLSKEQADRIISALDSRAQLIFRDPRKYKGRAEPLQAEPVQTTKEAWWAGYRAGKGLPPDMPREDAVAAQAEPVEMSPEFTDTARAALLWVLWHHQGGSSPVGQPLRFALGMGAHDRLSERQMAEAKRWAETSKSSTADFHATQPPQPKTRDYQGPLPLCAKCRKPDLCERRGACQDAAAAAPLQDYQT